MRLGWVLVLIFVATATAATPGASADGKCAGALPQALAGLPATVVVTTDCGRFRLAPGRNAVYIGPWKSPVPSAARGYWMDLTWYGRSHGHLLIGRGMERLWRSHNTYRGPINSDLGAVALGRKALAFGFFRGRRPDLYVARYGGRERLAARGESPLGFVPSGALVTLEDKSQALVLRSDSGRLERLIAPHVIEPQRDLHSGMLVYRVRHRLFVFDGTHPRQIAGLRRLGIRGTPQIEPLGRLVAVHDQRRLVVVAYDGRLRASTALPTRPKRADMVSSSVEANQAGTAVAFTATKGNTAYGSSGRETVYVLGAGDRQARPVLTEQVTFKVCERMASLAWRGRWLLYGNSERQAAIVDISGERPALDLSEVIARLPATSRDDGRFDVAWR